MKLTETKIYRETKHHLSECKNCKISESCEEKIVLEQFCSMVEMKQQARELSIEDQIYLNYLLSEQNEEEPPSKHESLMIQVAEILN